MIFGVNKIIRWFRYSFCLESHLHTNYCRGNTEYILGSWLKVQKNKTTMNWAKNVHTMESYTVHTTTTIIYKPSIISLVLDFFSLRVFILKSQQRCFPGSSSFQTPSLCSDFQNFLINTLHTIDCSCISIHTMSLMQEHFHIVVLKLLGFIVSRFLSSRLVPPVQEELRIRKISSLKLLNGPKTFT